MHNKYVVAQKWQAQVVKMPTRANISLHMLSRDVQFNNFRS